MNIKSFFSFDRMITPIIIKFLFIIGVIFAVIGGISTFFTGIIGAFNDGGFLSVILAIFGGPLTIVLGVLFSRLFAEMLILAFQINESLSDIKDILQKQE